MPRKTTNPRHQHFRAEGRSMLAKLKKTDLALRPKS
jgi:hypothetical protein